MTATELRHALVAPAGAVQRERGRRHDSLRIRPHQFAMTRGGFIVEADCRRLPQDQIAS
jgi:hypothetical protein